MSTLNIKLLCRKSKKKIPKLSPFASSLDTIINPQWLELPMSRTISYGPKDVRAIEVRLHIQTCARGGLNAGLSCTVLLLQFLCVTASCNILINSTQSTAVVPGLHVRNHSLLGLHNIGLLTGTVYILFLNFIVSFSFFCVDPLIRAVL